MNVPISNMWSTVLELSRTTAKTLLRSLQPAQVTAHLTAHRLLKLQQAKVLIRAYSRFPNGLADCVTLAYCSDCLYYGSYPVIKYLNSGADRHTLHLAPLLTFLKPTAHYFFTMKNGVYRTTANLTASSAADFLLRFLYDTDLYGGESPDTQSMGSAFCRYAAALLRASGKNEGFGTGTATW
jgi:hypothetical protein